MLNWMDNYYIGETVKHPDEIRQRLDSGKLVPGIYLITLSHNPHNILEILPSVVLYQPTAARLCPQIVGMAKGWFEAAELVRYLVDRVYRETGDVQVADYLKNR